ncbi:radical SAM protein [Oceanirhabdus sp. W0125-5]|uniref:radical SAM protein n=1 Tax=Oceanirhabdus sp. W0125-5 TaxID=2999116 RepID=UPI0022F32A40|nr:radical SAM protein [Oceanirhabdus sp. W0125-5]WBW95072.1 radical SAM protein [Oceanirhabdus sp. W0125-5]
MLSKKQEILSYFKYLQDKKPLAKLFRTDNFSYIFDTGTGKVVQCNDIEFTILDIILSKKNLEESMNKLSANINEKDFFTAMENVYNAIKEEDLLNVEVERKFHSPGHFNNLDQEINHNLRQIMLEVTERCNLRCHYCTYNDEYVPARNHGSKDMSLEVAYSAIDYLAAHGSKEEVYISFYGGEPLLMYDLIKKSVEYAKKTIKAKKINFNITTNLTLITSEIAEFFSSIKNFCVVGSLDGPKHIHDKFRQDINGIGSFDKALSGLKKLVTAFDNSNNNKILLSMVYTPPYSDNKLKEIKEFFNNLEWLPESVGNFITYPERNSIPLQYYNENKPSNTKDTSLLDWSEKIFLNSILNNDSTKTFTQDLTNTLLTRVHKREISNKAHFSFPLNGCCIPGKQRVYISPNGEVRICERVLGACSNGNVLSKIDTDKIKKVYVDDYKDVSLDTCSNCWISKVCSQCYATSFEGGKFNIEKRNSYCDSAKENFLSALKLYYKCYEHNPDSLLYLDTINIIS